MSNNPKRVEGARTKAATAGSVGTVANIKIGGEWKFSKKPAFIKERIAVWDELWALQIKKYEGFPREAIKITMPDGAVKEGKSFETSPFTIASAISAQFAGKIISAKVKYSRRIATLDDGLINPIAESNVSEDEQWFAWDLTRPFEGDCDLQLFKFEDTFGKETFWHSCAHVLGETLEDEFGCHLCHGPPTDAGFFYDCYSGTKDIFTEKHYKDIEKSATKFIGEKQTFNRLVLSKDEALRLFSVNPFKTQLIQEKIPEGGKVTAYKNGQLIDLCTGPHIPSTKIVKAFKVMKNSSAYWLGKAGNDSLQRIYGVSFPSKKEMDEHVKILEEQAARDHRNIGRKQELFDMNPLSPGCVFMFPKGATIYNNLMELIRQQYRIRGYSEVQTPNVYNNRLWKTSGHYINYKEDMFWMKVENQGFGMKSMNCPAHCLMFDNQQRSYRELPLRFADFGVLHRNELSGALSGLTRVRRFCQDDAHHFCESHQIIDEIATVLDFLDHIYGLFGFKFEMELSTRPEKRLGDEDLWDEAEAALTTALNNFGKPWKTDAGGGAFYGPKIDIKVYDAMKRAHQCGTVQLDFQLPIRFNLQYKTNEKSETKEEQIQVKKELKTYTFKKDEWDDEDYEWKEQAVKPGFSRPVMIHRAVLGSVERFMAILIEHLNGKWPLFLSPRQVMIVPISKKYEGYCHSVYLYLHQKGYEVATDFGNGQLPKKIRTHQLAQWNFILAAGEEEEKTGTVDIRNRDNERIGKMRVDELHHYFQSLMPNKSTQYEKFYAKAWDPATFSTATCGDKLNKQASASKGSGEKSKLYVDNNPSSFRTQVIQVVADISGANLEVEVTSDSSKSLVGKLPYLETADKSVLFDTSAIAQHLARQNPACGLLGSTPFEEQKVSDWIAWGQLNWMPVMHEVVLPILGVGKPVDNKAFTEGVKQLKEQAKVLDTYLKGKDWLVGSKITVADIYLGSSLATAFQIVLDAGFRKAMPNLAQWFERFSSDKAVVKRFGKIKACEKGLKPAAESAMGGKVTNPFAPAASKKSDAVDEDDLFGDDNEEDAAAAKKAAAKAKQGKKKEKKPVIAQSLVMFEIKPLDSDTDLDAVAKRVLAIGSPETGHYWKTEYKKVPVAFGIFKLIMGVTIEDEKVSVDGLQEEIEAFDDMVQSVDIMAFNKI